MNVQATLKNNKKR